MKVSIFQRSIIICLLLPLVISSNHIISGWYNYCWLGRVSLLIEIGCPQNFGTSWKRAFCTFMVIKPILLWSDWWKFSIWDGVMKNQPIRMKHLFRQIVRANCSGNCSGNVRAIVRAIVRAMFGQLFGQLFGHLCRQLCRQLGGQFVWEIQQAIVWAIWQATVQAFMGDNRGIWILRHIKQYYTHFNQLKVLEL